MRASSGEKSAVRGYFESQWPDDPVVHLEKVSAERVAGTLHDIWDVHTEQGRWWAVTNPLNLYSQDDFKSVDVVLLFHVGLAMRIAARDEIPINEGPAHYCRTPGDDGDRPSTR